MKIPLRRYWKLLRKYLRPLILQVILLFIAITLSVVLQLINPQMIRSFIDHALHKDSYDVLFKLAVGFIGLAFLQQLLYIFSSYIGKSVAWTSTNALREDLTRHCLQLDMAFHKTLKPGELIERVDGDVTVLLNFFSQLIIVLINNILLIAGVLILLFIEDWRIGLLQTVLVAITFFSLLKIQSIAVPHWKSVRQISSEFSGFTGEAISSTEDIKANGAKPFVMKRFSDLMKAWLPIQRKATILGYTNYTASIALIAFLNCAALGVGAMLWYKGSITIGTIYLFYMYTSYIMNPIDQIRRQLQELQRAEASIIRIEELFSKESTIKDHGNAEINEAIFDVCAQNIRFSYEEGEEVLKDLSFKLPKGKVLGVLGRTGSGKTTLARLLVRLYDNCAGEIYFGDNPIKSISMKSLREKVVYVTQDIQLFNASVRDNLTFFNKDIKDEDILMIIEEIGLSAWYKSLPAGLDSRIEPVMTGLSAGEAQLLALVRAFLKKPSLIILDEASSRLDNATEGLVQSAIKRVLEGKTGIIIAHRLATVQCADDIMILENGVIKEYNARETLEKDVGSYYNSLLRRGVEEVLV